MKKTTKKYVEYLYPGLLFSETSSMEIDHNDPMKVEEKERAIGFRFYEKEFVIDGKEQFEGKRNNVSNWYYIGKRLTFDEVLRQFGNSRRHAILINNMKYNKIESVCMTEFGNFMPLEDGDMTLEEYKREHDQERKAKEMFEKLKQHIGEQISYKAWWYGAEEQGTDTLEAVNYFSNIVTKYHGIPFIGSGAAISSIILTETGEELYRNPFIEQGYDRRFPEDIEDSKRKFFGEEITNKQRDRRIKAEQQRKENMERANKETTKKKYKVMKEGLAFIKEDTLEEWMEFVNNNMNDAYSGQVTEASLQCLKKLKEGANFQEIEQIYNQMGLTGFMAGAVSNTIVHFSPRGEEFRQYWNRRFGVSEEKKETVNPAVFVLK